MSAPQASTVHARLLERLRRASECGIKTSNNAVALNATMFPSAGMARETRVVASTVALAADDDARLSPAQRVTLASSRVRALIRQVRNAEPPLELASAASELRAPVTAVERYVQHIKRLKYARERYFSSHPTY